MSTLDVRTDHLKMVHDILKHYIPDREVWAFGSRVKGSASNTSDLDLCILGEAPLSFETLANLRDAFSESNIPYRVDVVDWATTDPNFRAIIEKDRISLQNKT